MCVTYISTLYVISKENLNFTENVKAWSPSETALLVGCGNIMYTLEIPQKYEGKSMYGFLRKKKL